jgi:hypothetical protein
MTNFSNEMIFGWGRSLPGYAFHYSGFTVIEESSGFSEEYQNVDNQGFYPSAFVFQPPTGSDAYGNGVALAAAFIQGSPLPPTLNVSLLDPAPDLLNGPAVMNGSQLQNSLTKGRVVSGVATDGVAQLVVRIDTNSPGEQLLSPCSMTRHRNISKVLCQTKTALWTFPGVRLLRRAS